MLTINILFTIVNLLIVINLIDWINTEVTHSRSFTKTGSCPFGRRMSSAELMHSVTLASFNDTFERQMFESEVNRIMSRQQRNQDGFFYGIRSYLKHCVKPVLSCVSIYRSYNGVCNNLKNSKWGSANSCLLRILPAHYRDDVADPVGENEGLPSASLVSVALRSTTRSSSQMSPVDTTDLFFAFGQFLDHDLASSVISSVVTASNPSGDCCFTQSLNQCSMALNVTVDPFYQSHGIDCINFVRAARCPCSSTRQRQQMNAATSYIDLSQLYGNSQLEARSLKNRRRPYLLDTYGNGVLLPLGGEHCVSSKCFRGADNRINQQAALIALHTIFVRHHNNIAEKLHLLNPKWTNERVFEEARRINIAQFQVVVVKEFLPLLLGESLLRQTNIAFDQISHGTDYDDASEAGILNEFLAAAFRLHTIIPEQFAKGLEFNFFNTSDFFQEGSDHCTSVLESLMSSRGKAARFPVSDVIAHHVYDTDGDFGLDLVAINIQRGRDHGLRPYTNYVAYLRNVTIEKFSDLNEIMSNNSVMILRRIYNHVNDIDLYVGGYLEKPSNGLLSETIAAIVVKQFELLIKADRFFVTHGSYFTRPQLESIMTTSLAGILCSTTDLAIVSKLPLRELSKSRNMVSCRDVELLNMKHWADQ